MSYPTTPTNNDCEDTLQYIDYCQIIDCYEQSTESIRVPAGKYGMIPIKVCRKCRYLFDEADKE